MKVLDRIEKIKNTEQELEVLARLKYMVEWAVVKRWAGRYIENLRKASFKLTEENPSYLAARHAEFAGQALGIKTLIKFIEKAGEKIK